MAKNRQQRADSRHTVERGARQAAGGLKHQRATAQPGVGGTVGPVGPAGGQGGEAHGGQLASLWNYATIHKILDKK
jgi:hypothetical protein